MSATLTDPAIDDADLDAEVPCEVWDHEHPADIYVASECPRCSNAFAGGMCWAYWRHLAGMGLRCAQCRTVALRDACFRIVQVLR
jgi:hypothetical protein